MCSKYRNKGPVALEDKSVYLCQKTVITMKNQVRPVCSPKDKIWLQTDKLQRCRRLPMEQAKAAKLRQILESKSEGVLFRKCLTDFAVKLITFSIPNNLNPARATNPFCTKCNNFHNIHNDGSIPVCPASPYILNDRGNPPGGEGYCHIWGS